MEKHWLYRTENRKKIWTAGIVVLVICVLLEFIIKSHPHFSIEEFFSFYAVFGFLSCVVMVVFAKLLGYLIKRRDDYYDS